MKKTNSGKAKSVATANDNPAGSTQTLSQCYLEHAARETQWAAGSANQGEYQSAANALTRRGVWLTAALIAQERKL